MPLFKCTNPECGCIENTAVGYYWGVGADKVLCSECHTGEWHGHFPKRKVDPEVDILLPTGYYGKKVKNEL